MTGKIKKVIVWSHSGPICDRKEQNSRRSVTLRCLFKKKYKGILLMTFTIITSLAILSCYFMDGLLSYLEEK